MWKWIEIIFSFSPNWDTFELKAHPKFDWFLNQASIYRLTNIIIYVFLPVAIRNSKKLEKLIFFQQNSVWRNGWPKEEIYRTCSV